MRPSFLYSFILLFICFGPVFAQAEFSLTGEYQGKNIFVQNPLSGDRINFCTQSVYLNGELVISQPKTSAFAVDLGHLAVGDAVYIRILHRTDCQPKVINPQVIRSKSPFRFLELTVDGISVNWTAAGEQPYGKYFLEQYRNQKWVNLATVSGKGNFDWNQYTFAPNHHTGENRYRIKYMQGDGELFFSRVATFFHDVEPVSFYPTLVTDKITLSRESDYSVQDTYGNVLLSGKAVEIPLKQLTAGLYILLVDNREERFVKK